MCRTKRVGSAGSSRLLSKRCLRRWSPGRPTAEVNSPSHIQPMRTFARRQYTDGSILEPTFTPARRTHMFDRSTRSARTIPLLVSLAAAFAAIAGCSFDPTAPGAGIERGFVSHPLETELLRQVNDYRSSYGLHALTMNDVLSRQARLHSEDMAKGRMRFGHDGFKQRATTI